MENKYEIIDFYKSLNKANRTTDEDIVILLINQDIIPETIRYSNIHKGVKGAIRDNVGDIYYFNYVPDTSFRIVKAKNDEQIAELTHILTKAKLGADLTSESTADEDKDKLEVEPGESVKDSEDLHNKEDEEKAGASGGSSGGQQNQGGGGNMDSESISMTPDRPDVGFDWHGDNFKRSIEESTALMKSFTSNIQTLVPDKYKLVPVLEKRYLKEILKYKDEDIMKGIKLNPFQKTKYLQWVKEQAIKKTISLENWLNNGQS